jgi:hypothetical protein
MTGFLAAGSGRSMARLLMAVLVVSFSLTMVFMAFRHGVFNAAEAAALGTLSTGLMAVWGVGKWKASTAGAAAPTAPGAQGVPMPEPGPDGGNP